MRLPDPLGIKHTILSHSLCIASYQALGERSEQQDFFLTDNDNTFVLADGMSGLPYGDIAGKLTADSALWSIQLAKQRFAYWKDKKLLGGRIMRSVNWTVFKKGQQLGSTKGIGSTLTIIVFGEKQFYIYSIGDSPAYVLREKKLYILTPKDRNEDGYHTKAIGIQKTAPKEFFYTDQLLANDLFLLASDGVADYISTENLQKILSKTLDTMESCNQSCKQIIGEAERFGSKDNMTACIIKNLVY